jgi:hypothetical protein
VERTYLIVPAWSDQADQCKIVSRDGRHPKALLSYRENHELWAESGIMNSQGQLVCLDNAALWEEMKADEPLAAGTVYYCEAPAEQPHPEPYPLERSRA